MAEDRSYPVTKKGLQKLRDELEELINVKKPELAERLRIAIAQGDLSENADYINAKEEQGFLEGRIAQLDETVRGAKIIKQGAGPEGEVVLGSQVIVLDDEGSKATYQLVGPSEANPREGRISHESPLGKALLDGKPGDKVSFSAPAGDIIYKIVDVS